MPGHGFGLLKPPRGSQQRWKIALGSKVLDACGRRQHFVDRRRTLHAEQIGHIAELQIEIEQERTIAEALAQERT